MIGKNKKGKSFGGAVRYVLNEGHEIIEAEGVLAEDAATIIRDFAIQRSGRPEIKQPVGHIVLSFSPEDAPRLTNEFLRQLANEYKREMGVINTQYVIVRHYNTDNPHIHILYNRIDNDLNLISVNNDYKRNIKVCKKLKDKHELTYGKGKEKVNRPKLKGADKVKYEIHDQIAAILPKCIGYSDLEKRLAQGGITIQYKYRSGAEETEENIQGVSFRKDNYSFKGSEIDRKFSHGNLKKAMSANLNEAWEKMKDEIMPEVDKWPEPQMDSPKPEAKKRTETQSGISPTESVERSEPATRPTTNDDQSWKIAMGMIEDPAQKKPVAPRPSAETAPPKPVEQAPARQEQKLVEPSQPEQKPAPSVKRNPRIGGVELTDEHNKTLQDGGHIYLENMEKKDGSGVYSGYVFLNDEKKKAFYSRENPDTMVEYGKWEMRLRDKMLIEKGHITRAKIKYYGIGSFARPYLWKPEAVKREPSDIDVVSELCSDSKYHGSWSDPRISKEVHEKELEEFRKKLRERKPQQQQKNKGPKPQR